MEGLGRKRGKGGIGGKGGDTEGGGVPCPAPQKSAHVCPVPRQWTASPWPHQTPWSEQVLDRQATTCGQ